jgi:chromosome condensin MukBEF ATPase and DNA-binding subunit MukB
MRINLTHAEIERHAYMNGDGLVAMLAENAADIETIEADFEQRLTDAFEAGKLEASEAELIAEIESLNVRLKNLGESLMRAHSLLDSTNAWLTGPNCKNAKGRDTFRKALRSDQLRIGRS